MYKFLLKICWKKITEGKRSLYIALFIENFTAWKLWIWGFKMLQFITNEWKWICQFNGCENQKLSLQEVPLFFTKKPMFRVENISCRLSRWLVAISATVKTGKFSTRRNRENPSLGIWNLVWRNIAIVSLNKGARYPNLWLGLAKTKKAMQK